MKLTISKEDYLKAIAEAQNEEEPVIAATIARWLKITPPAVALALRRLQRDNLIKVGNGGRISLTGAGRQISDRLRRRHRLIERMLTEMLGMEWYKVHDEAERLEHAVSDDLEQKLMQKLGEDGPCPHGDEAGMGAAQRRKAGLRLLAEVPAGVRVQAVSTIRKRSLSARISRRAWNSPRLPGRSAEPQLRRDHGPGLGRQARPPRGGGREEGLG